MPGRHREPTGTYANLELCGEVAIVTGALSDMGAVIRAILEARGAIVLAADIGVRDATSTGASMRSIAI